MFTMQLMSLIYHTFLMKLNNLYFKRISRESYYVLKYYTFLLVLSTKHVIPTVLVMLNLTYLISLYFKIKHICFIVRTVLHCYTFK